jgi:hypothetical protein
LAGFRRSIDDFARDLLLFDLALSLKPLFYATRLLLLIEVLLELSPVVELSSGVPAGLLMSHHLLLTVADEQGVESRKPATRTCRIAGSLERVWV